MSERHAPATPFDAIEGDWAGGLPAQLLRATCAAITTLVAETRETTDLGALPPNGMVRAVMQSPSPKDLRYVPADAGCPACCIAVVRILRGRMPDQAARPMDEVPETDWHVVLDAKLIGAFPASQGAVPGAKRRGGAASHSSPAPPGRASR